MIGYQPEIWDLGLIFPRAQVQIHREGDYMFWSSYPVVKFADSL